MAKPELPAELPEILSTTVALTTERAVGSVWDVGIHGIGFMISTLDQESPFEFRSYEIQSIAKQRPRIDDSEEPGEQTLDPWWPRAQHSWHEGAGQEVFDSEFSSRFKFKDSRGLDVWTEGEASLLKDTEELRNDNVDDHHLLATPDALFYTVDGVVHRDTDPDTAGTDSLADHSGTEINDLASDGEFLYAAFSAALLGIKKTPLAGTLAWTDVNDQTDVEKIAFVKGRLIGAKGSNLYEYDLAVTDEPEPLNAPMPSTWKWSGITESGPAIYFSGHAGDRSEIFAVRLTAQDIPFASTTTLGAMISVWQAPEGETVHTIKGYLGQQVLIGTSHGVRVGTIVTGDGNLEVSGLIAETDQPVLSFEPQLEFAWFSWSQFDATHTGLGRVHLGDLAYASDLMYSSTGEVKEIVQYQGRNYFIVDEGVTSRIIKEHATDLTPEAFMDTGEIRFGTFERKVLRYFDLLTKGEGRWTLDMALDGGTFTPYTTDNETGGTEEEGIRLEATRFRIRLTLKPNPVDATSGPTLLDWRLRAEPKATGRFRYLVPVMVYDYVNTRTGALTGKVGLALTVLDHLVAIYRSDQDITFQPLQSSVPGADTQTLPCRIEDLRFKTYTPPQGGKGFGGIALVVLREVR